MLSHRRQREILTSNPLCSCSQASLCLSGSVRNQFFDRAPNRSDVAVFRNGINNSGRLIIESFSRQRFNVKEFSSLGFNDSWNRAIHVITPLTERSSMARPTMLQRLAARTNRPKKSSLIYHILVNPHYRRLKSPIRRSIFIVKFASMALKRSHVAST